MDTESFFRRVLPSGGLKILAELVQIPGRDKPGWRYTTYESLAAMAEAVAQLDAKRRTIYHACNGYGDWYEEEVKGKVKRRIRTQRNVVACRSLYDDIDIGKPGCYATKKEAAGEVLRFCKEYSLPVPMMVSSGGGLHLYWSFEEDVTPQEWLELSTLKRAATRAFGLKVDPSCDMDLARVLRPVGSTWRKYGERVVSVRVGGDLSQPSVFRTALAGRVGEAADGGLSFAAPRVFAGLAISTDLAAVEYPPSSLAEVAKHCAQVRVMRDTQGDVGYEHWRGVIGLAKYAIEGLPIAVEWSAQRAATGHGQTDTEAKFDTWSTGPATCDFFRQNNPAGCEGCPHKVKSPIQLGHTAESAAPVITVEPQAAAVEEAPQAQPVDADLQPAHWPEGYRPIGEDLAAFAPDPKDPDGPGGWQRFARPLFYPVERIKLEDGTYAMRIVMQAKPGAPLREFRVPTKAFADPKTMKSALGAYEISIFNPQLAIRYMQDYLTELRRKTEERYTFQQFGWRDDFSAFLIGDKLISAGATTTVELGSSVAPDLRRCGDVRGTKEQWVNGVDMLYNVQNGEPYQYAICTAFGAVVAPLIGFEEWAGIPLALTSSDSGLGKSTVAKIAVNALSNAAITTPRDITPYALLKRASTMKNLCVLFDEITQNVQVNASRAGLIDVLYALSNGHGRVRLGSDGSEKKSDPPWCLMSILTGNRNLFFNLSESKINPEAAQMRVFEVDINAYPRVESMKGSKAHAEVAQRLVSECAGVFAEDFIRYVLANTGSIQQQLRTLYMKIIGALGEKSSKERFYAYHVTCTLVGGLIAQQLGAHRFDMGRLRRWAMNHILYLRGEAAKYNLTTEDQFSAMLADLHGTIIVTKHFDTLSTKANKVELPLMQVRSPISGRLVLGGEAERGKLFIATRAIDQWCREHGVSPGQFRTTLESAGLIRKVSAADGRHDRKVVLSKGVPSIPTGQTRCLEFEFAACQGYMDEFVKPQEEKEATECA